MSTNNQPPWSRLKETFWRTLYANWRTKQEAQTPGYSLLLMVPGDLPVFLKIATEVCAAQDPDHLVETLVVPDQPSRQFTRAFESIRRRWPHGPMRQVALRPLDRLFTRTMNNPHINCWLQFIRGVEAAKSTHLLWHDADLFITDPTFLSSHYQKAREGRYACMGVSKPWDPWFSAHNLDHLTATWELLSEVNWLRQFRPWEHRGHENVLHGERHVFDITFWPQCHTEPSRVGRHPQELGFIHFSYVICSYRRFQNARGPIEDDNLALLLVRLLIDAFDPSDWAYAVPPVEELAKGLKDPKQPVTYHQAQTRENYTAFRNRLERLMASGLVSPSRVKVMRRGVEAFDQAFAWESTVSAGAFDEDAPTAGG